MIPTENRCAASAMSGWVAYHCQVHTCPGPGWCCSSWTRIGLHNTTQAASLSPEACKWYVCETSACRLKHFTHVSKGYVVYQHCCTSGSQLSSLCATHQLKCTLWLGWYQPRPVLHSGASRTQELLAGRKPSKSQHSSTSLSAACRADRGGMCAAHV